MRELYIDCTNGAAGDMLSAALLELFSDKAAMLSRLNAIGIPGVVFTAERAESYSIAGTCMNVSVFGEHEGEKAFNMPQHGAHLSDIEHMLEKLMLPEAVRLNVHAVYRLIAEAESEVHGRDMEHIHFHELGTLDALADISAFCLMLHELGVEHIVSSPVCTGFGEVRCAHGLLPVPAPATAIILKNIPCTAGECRGERCTPTGAALIKHFAAAFSPCPDMTVKAIGTGIGKKDFGRPNILRLMLGGSEETAVELSCNVDDMSPEDVGYAIDALFAAGAADVFYTPIGMKKNRPGLLLSVICRESLRDEMVRLIFKHCSTIGIREALCRRYVLKRREETVSTPYGPVRLKLSEGYGCEKQKFEYEDLARLARNADISLEDVRELVKGR